MSKSSTTSEDSSKQKAAERAQCFNKVSSYFFWRPCPSDMGGTSKEAKQEMYVYEVLQNSGKEKRGDIIKTKIRLSWCEYFSAVKLLRVEGDPQ